MARKPYIHKQPDGWYKKNSFYIWYMLREATSLTTAITALNLFYGIACLAGSQEAWMGWIAWQKNPIMFLLNLAGIVGALLNSKTWFEAIPKNSCPITSSSAAPGARGGAYSSSC